MVLLEGMDFEGKNLRDYTRYFGCMHCPSVIEVRDGDYLPIACYGECTQYTELNNKKVEWCELNIGGRE